MLTDAALTKTKKSELELFKGGVIMDVTTPEQAKIAEKAGACAVMAQLY
jgi:pyridoxal 5'-phosphate synthase pdxS subunit